MQRFQSQRGTKQRSVTFGRRMTKTLALRRWQLVLSSGWLGLEQQQQAEVLKRVEQEQQNWEPPGHAQQGY